MAQVCVLYRIVNDVHQQILVNRCVETFYIGLTDVLVITLAVLYLDYRLLQSIMTFEWV
jgi:hypothetical protein